MGHRENLNHKYDYNMTTKCPYCAEYIQEDAIICKHCKSKLLSTDDSVYTPAIDNKEIEIRYLGIFPAKDARIITVFLLLLLSFGFWFITIPAIVIWCLWKKAKFTQKTNIIATFIIVIVFIIWESMIVYGNREPILLITEPQNNFSVHANSINIKGKVDPNKSTVIVNDVSVNVNPKGEFSYELQLSEEKNLATIKAKNNNKIVTSVLYINRIFTKEELAERERQKAKEEAKKQAALEAQKKAEEQRKAKKLAEQKAWEQSKAGQICIKHSEWTKDDCINLADNKIWIGMTIDMLKYKRGLPDSANPSNYGSGTEWQWCWFGRTPSCFYDKNDDGVIDSYN